MLNFISAKKVAKNLISKTGYSLVRLEENELQFLSEAIGIYEKYSLYTMIPRKTFIENLRLCRKIESTHGCIVECGVWRGGMIASIAEMLGNNRSYYLFDSFEGLPSAQKIDGVDALSWQSNKDSAYYFDNCKAEEIYAHEAMKMSGVSNYKLVKGWFSDTVSHAQFDEPIALLRLDGDWYDSTMQCIEALYPKIAQGGIVIVDDYYVWDGCSRAIHDYLSLNKLSCKIRQIQNNCYIIKNDV